MQGEAYYSDDCEHCLLLTLHMPPSGVPGWCIPSSLLKESLDRNSYTFSFFMVFFLLFRAAASILWISFFINVWFVNLILKHMHIPVLASSIASPVLLLI